MLYTFFITKGALLGIHLISTAPERLCILAVLTIFLFQSGKRLALIKNKRLVSILLSVVITLVIGIYLRHTLLRIFPAILIIYVLTLFLLSMRLPFAKRKKLVSAAVAALITMSISANYLSDLHRFIFHDPSVTEFARGGFNGLALDMD